MVEINGIGFRRWVEISAVFSIILLFSSCVKRIPLSTKTDNLIKNSLHSHSQIKTIRGVMNILIHGPDMSFTTSGNFYYKKPNMFRLNMFEGFIPEREDVILLPDMLLLPPQLQKVEIIDYDNMRYIIDLIWGEALFLPERYKVKEKKGCYIVKTRQFNICIDRTLGEITEIKDKRNRMTMVFANFKEIDGLLLPNRIRVKYMGGEINMSFRQLQVNQNIPGGVFEVEE